MKNYPKNTLNELINVDMKGEILVEIFEDGVLVKEQVIKNAIQANAKDIIAHALGEGLWKLDRIAAYNTSSLLYNQAVTLVDYPIGTAVRVKAIFGPSTFTGVVDELRLQSNLGGIFSIVTGITITKGVNTIISVTWKITII